MKKPNPQQWTVCVKRDVTIFPAFGVTESFGNTAATFGIPFNYKNVRFVESQWVYPASEFETMKDIFKNKLIDSPSYATKIVVKQYKAGEALKKFIASLNKKKQYTKKELVPLLRTYIKRMHGFYAFWWIINPGEEVMEEAVKHLLKEKSVPLEFNELFFVTRPLELFKERITLAKIAKEIHTKNYEKLPVSIQKKLQRHAKRYGWMSCSYHRGTPLTARDFFQTTIESNPSDVFASARRAAQEKKRVSRILKKYLSVSEQRLVGAMHELIFSHNYQKETVNECQHNSEPFLREIAKQLSMAWPDFLTLTPYEALPMLEGKHGVSEKEIRARQKDFAILLHGKKCTVVTHTRPYHVRLTKTHATKQSNILTGIPACRGKITGVVRVIQHKEEMGLFQTGQILVTNMTTIDYVPIMKKAKAIITNEGGITCHAAIFSRELGIPCIIGTKIATKVFKDGDMVEVDASRGIVKKL